LRKQLPLAWFFATRRPQDGNPFPLSPASLMQQTLLREQISPVSNNPLFELAQQIYLAVVATDRSQPSSDRTKRRVEVERIANGSDSAQIERGGCSFHSTGRRGWPRRTAHDTIDQRCRENKLRWVHATEIVRSHTASNKSADFKQLGDVVDGMMLWGK
jgi:hypothetical protein